ncbi:MAG: T9SS type A sorting domain-containing protein [Bacteroidia bacterium]
MIRFLSISIFLLFSVNLSATHTLGGTYSWEEIGQDTFKVTLTIYRDCNGVRLSNSPITAQTICGTKRLNTTLSAGEDITPVCKEECSRCNNSNCTFRYGIEKYNLTTILIVDQWRKNGCCTVTLSWSQCCRSKNITSGGANQNQYLESTMYICDTLNDQSSPLWMQNPPLIVCLGRDLIYNLGAQNVNKSDSLVYSFAEPKTSATGKTTWTNNYSYDKPMGYLGFPRTNLPFPRGIHLDSFSGIFMVRPMKLEYTILTTKVEVYRNGNSRGVVIRESPLIVLKCPDNNPPVLSGVNCSTPKPNQFKVNFCTNSLNVLEICVSDKEKDDEVRYEYSTDMKNASIEYDKTNKRPRLQVKWKPLTSDVGKTFTLHVKAIDNACPVNGETSRVYTINVIKGINYSVGSFADSCSNGSFYFKSFDTTRMRCVTWQHKSKFISPCIDSPYSDTATFNFKKPGNKTIKLHIPTVEGCKIEDSIPFLVGNYATYISLLNDTTVCAYDTIDLKARLNNPNGVASINWSTGLVTNKLLSNQKIGLGQANAQVIVNYKDSACSGSDTSFITVNKPHILSFTKNIKVCRADSDTFRFEQLYYYNDLDSFATYIWKDSVGNLIDSTNNPYFIFPYNGQYTFTSIDGFGCAKIDSIKYKLHDKIERFYLIDSLLCINAVDTIKAQRPKYGSLKWFKSGGSRLPLASDTVAIVQKLNDTANYRLEYTQNGSGCKAIKRVTAYPIYPSDPKFRITDNLCSYDTFKVTSNYKSKSWAIDGLIETGNFEATPIKYGYNSGELQIKFSGRDSNYCQLDSFTTIQILETPVTKIWAKDSLLKNEVFYPIPSIKQKHNYSFFWEFGDPVFMTFSDYQPQVSFDTLGSISVRLTVSNQNNGCTTSTVKKNDIVVQRFPTSIETPRVEINLYPNPSDNVIFISSKTFIEEIEVFTLDGKLIFEKDLSPFNQSFNVKNLKNGMYLVVLKSDNVIKERMIFSKL